MTIPNIVLVEKNKLSQAGVWVWILALTPSGSGTTYRYTNNTVAVTYGGNTYNPVPFRIAPIEKSADGQLQVMQVIITDIGLSLQSVIRANNGLRGASVTLTQVNTDLLAQDFSGDSVTYQVGHCQNRYVDIILHCGVPGSLKRRVPEDQYMALQCRHDFRIPSGAYGSRCGYEGKTIVAITLPSGTPVSVQVNTHGYATGTVLRIYGATEIAGLDDDYTITSVDGNNFTLDGTDGDDFSGVYTTGGKAGYAKCPRVLTTCRSYQGGQGTPYGGIAAARADAIQLAL